MTDILTLAQQLLQRASVTPDDAGCQALIAERLRASGFNVEAFKFNDVDNLWLTHGDPNSGPTLILLGHTDVVPSGPIETWASDPFTPSVRDGKLYARGAADMKSSVAAFVIAAEEFIRLHPDHVGRLGILLTSDEEGDAIDGVRKVAELFRARNEPLQWCITGEPSSKQQLGDLLRVGRRGSLSAHLLVHGIQGHVAYPAKARNPIHAAMPALAELAQHVWDEGYETFPPTSLQISNFMSGTGANNVIPGNADILFNLRYNPNWTAQQLEVACEQILKRHGVNYSMRWHRSGEPFYTPEGKLRAAARAVLTEATGSAPEESTGGGTSDARFIAPLGVECIEIGPVNASIHQVNEHIAINDLQQLPGLYLKLIEKLLL